MSAMSAERPERAAGRPRRLPVIIQGGMGVGVSCWQLAREVSRAGQLGVVSGVALDAVVARRLQRGDPGGDIRRALAAFPAPEVAGRVLDRYYVAGGIAPGRPFRPIPRLGLRASQPRSELLAVASFAEVFLAKEGHDGLVGINLMEKVQMATPASVYGAMLAGVDYVLVGAGIPVGVAGMLDDLAAHRAVAMPAAVADAPAAPDVGEPENPPAEDGAESADDGDPAGQPMIRFDPATILPEPGAALARPRFLAIISSAVLATYLNRSDASRPDGFVLEGPVAGGHSAPPRGRLRLDDAGEPVYGDRDVIDTAKVMAAGLPFWLAGGYSTPGKVRAALAAGAAGVQVGTPFALARESGIEPGLKQELLDRAAAGKLTVRNSPQTSPAGFPFKVADLPGTVADEDVYAERPRLCDLGYLRVPFHRAGDGIGYRCPAEPEGEYERKAGAAGEADGRRCLCNGLLATIGLGQHRATGYVEPAIVTLGQDLAFLPDLLDGHGTDFGAADVVRYLMDGAVPAA